LAKKKLLGKGKMITKIPEEQKCQAFDPKMNFPPSVLEMHGATENANVSCVTTAFVYIEGSHGNKFLCDYHYHYELYMSRQGYSHPENPWQSIVQYVVDERERVKDTFAKNVTTTDTLGHKCSLINSYDRRYGCTADALVKVIPIKMVEGKINFTTVKDMNNMSDGVFYCNFHFRRESNRYYNNGVVYEDFHKVIDERYRMKMTLAEEAEKLTYV
jgi:hypothetical protein